MQDEVARLCEQLGISETEKTDCGRDFLQLAWSKNSSHDMILSEVKHVAQGHTLSLEASRCMQKVRNIPCHTLQVSMVDESCADKVGWFEESEPTLSSGLPYTISSQTSEVPVID
jgi:hypothetical protein